MEEDEEKSYDSSNYNGNLDYLLQVSNWYIPITYLSFNFK